MRGSSMAPGMGVTLCRDSAEPLREETGDNEPSLAMVCPAPPAALASLLHPAAVELSV